MSHNSEIIETGVIEHGTIALDHPLPIADGVKVRVVVQEIAQVSASPVLLSEAEFRALPFHGEWADRTDLPSSEEYIREERAKWSQRLFREG